MKGIKLECPVGQRFGRSVIIGDALTKVYANGVTQRRWLARCDCGATFEAHGSSFLKGQRRSCPLCRTGKPTHGATVNKEIKRTSGYRAWSGMRARCLNPGAQHYARYGGRGISVCARWDDFALFILDMGPRPSPHHSIERKENDLGYSPENCCWATAKEQARNRSNNRLVSAFGEIKTLAEWSEIRGIDWATLNRRLSRGMSPEDALQLARRSGQVISRADKRLSESPSPSKYLGVHWNASSSKWVARIWDGKRTLYLGIFTEGEDAARAYDATALRLRGLTAQLNFPAQEPLQKAI